MIDSLTYPVTFPKNIPNGKAVFYWAWINRLGNREYYANCADIIITGSTGSDYKGPQLLVADIYNWIVPENTGTEQVGIPLMNLRPIIGLDGPPPPTNPIGPLPANLGSAGTDTPAQSPVVVPTPSPTPSPPVTPVGTQQSTPTTDPSTPPPTVPSTDPSTPPTVPSGGGSTSDPGCVQGSIICQSLTEFATCVWGTLVSQPMAPGTNCQQNGNSISIVFAGQANNGLTPTSPTDTPPVPSTTPTSGQCTSGVVSCLASNEVQSCLNGVPFTAAVPNGATCNEVGSTAVISMQ